MDQPLNQIPADNSAVTLKQQNPASVCRFKRCEKNDAKRTVELLEKPNLEILDRT